MHNFTAIFNKFQTCSYCVLEFVSTLHDSHLNITGWPSGLAFFEGDASVLSASFDFFFMAFWVGAGVVFSKANKKKKIVQFHNDYYKITS